MWVAPSAGNAVTMPAIARESGCSVSLDSEMDATAHPVPDRGASRRGAALSATPVNRHGFDTRHAGYFDGEWERP